MRPAPTTIASRVSNILSKLGVTSRTEAVILALHNRIVQCPIFDLPQLADANIPQPMDVAGEYFL